jgi:transposase-like protein
MLAYRLNLRLVADLSQGFRQRKISRQTFWMQRDTSPMSRSALTLFVVTFLLWSNGNSIYPKCGTVQGERKHYWLDAQKRWKCYSCRKQFSVKVDTIFEDSPISLDKWMMVLWMLCTCKNDVSS